MNRKKLVGDVLLYALDIFINFFRYLFLTQIVPKSTAAAAMMTTQKFENGYL